MNECGCPWWIGLLLIATPILFVIGIDLLFTRRPQGERVYFMHPADLEGLYHTAGWYVDWNSNTFGPFMSELAAYRSLLGLKTTCITKRRR